MKKLVLIFSVLFGLCEMSNAQFELTPVSDWMTVSSTKDFKISYTYADCRIPSEGLFAEYILLRLENLSKETVEVTWYNDTYYDGECTNCDHESRDRLRRLVLAPGEVREGRCKVGLNEGLRIHRKWLDLQGYPVLDKAVMTEVSVNSLEK
ncbi:hypothetical protein [Luteibaculum oceani]|uniref:Uncharacterized protein n=1 Tax=Luteibaculum oceani TaxID=1294296 RepID=A0A5C6V984_9FLAO|nr:hypothetical protein [Luteibaculum oceani]TXC81687.1 hypothetical protein FRX97_03995 [Luteibaculum oceani]